MDGVLEGLGRWGESKEEGVRTLVGGDFNARTGREGGGIVEEEMEKEGGEEKIKRRNSKDIKVNGKGRRLVECMERIGWSIFNGSLKGNKEGEYTFTGGRGNTVIDYVIGDEEVKEEISRLLVRDKVDSDHQPVEVWINKGKRKCGKCRAQRKWKELWNEEGSRLFVRKLGKMEVGERKIGEEWEEMEAKVRKAMKETEMELGRKKKRGWWDEECEKAKKDLKRELGEWRQ